MDIGINIFCKHHPNEELGHELSQSFLGVLELRVETCEKCLIEVSEEE